MAKRISLNIKDNKILRILLISVIYVVVSLSTFIAVKIFFPIISNYGLNSISIIPGFLTYIMPLFIFFMVILYIHASTINNKRMILLILGLVITLFGVFGIIMAAILMGVVYEGNTIVGNTTPIFPLDVLLINMLYLLLGISLLVFKHIDKNNEIINPIMTKKISNKKFVLLGFYLPFSMYFFGQCLWGFMYVFEGYWSPNWYGVMPAYFLFALMTVGLIFFINCVHDDKHNKNRLALISLLSTFLYLAIFGIWFLIAIFVNPYLVPESMQWEFEILYSISYPFGLLIIVLWVLIPLIYYFAKTIRNSRKEKTNR